VKGQAILRQGSTGRSSGEHLHAEILDSNGGLITNNAYTRPIIEQWQRDIQAGVFLQSPAVSNPSETGLQPNGRAAQYGHPGYNEAANLTTISRTPDGYEYKLQPQAATAWRRMVNDAKYEGVTLTPVSAFRSVAEQQRLWESQVQRQGSPEAAARVSAPPGHSEHHTGLTLDINSLEASFENTPAFQWLTNNASRYGYSMSYPKDGSGAAGYEPWHWSYTGVQRGGSGGAGLPGQGGGRSRSANTSSFRPTRQIGLGQSIASSAGRLGVKPDELASVLALESSLDINSRGGDGDRYVGLWQAGDDAQQRYGVYQGMPAGQQMAALETYLKDRGYEPGMGIAALYSTILAGNPFDVNSADSNETTAASAAAMFRPGGRHHNTAREILGF
jgi:LAS superfamily LD-carboxypeptidase LdcB